LTRSRIHRRKSIPQHYLGPTFRWQILVATVVSLPPHSLCR
jgi:hypothetical protein